MEFYGISTVLPPYIPYPRFLLSLPLNETARLVYCLILSRIQLSQSNGWVDEEGRVFCRYTIESLMEDTHKSKSTIVTALSDLEKQGLLMRRRGGMGNTNQLYLKVPENSTTKDLNPVPSKYEKPAPNKKKRNNPNQLNYEYVGDSL